jgi:hypothetical protein
VHLFVANCRLVAHRHGMTKHERAQVAEIIQQIDASDTVPNIVGIVCRTFPAASEERIDEIINAVYDGIEFPSA